MDKKEKMSSNFVALGLAIFVIGGALYFVMSDEKFLSVGVYGFAMMLPCSVMFSPTKYDKMLLFYTIAMAIIGAGAIVITFNSGELFNILTFVFIIGFVAFQWVANFLIIAENNR